MAKIYKINYSLKNLRALYNKRLNNSDYEGALCVLNTMRNNNAQNYEIYEGFAKIYYLIEEYEGAINSWYSYLSCCPEGYEVVAFNGLGACFYRLESKNLAGYYFNEQLSYKNSSDLEYNNVVQEFYDEITDKKGGYYLAYPYNLANFDLTFQEVAGLIKAGYVDTALNKLEIVPSDSKYYPDALSQKSLCKFLLGKNKEALKDISLATKLDKENGVYLINAISMFFASNKKAETEELLTRLMSSKVANDIEFFDKIAMIYAEMHNYIMAEKFFDKYLKKYPYKLSSLLLNGITKYNLFKFNEAIDLFSKFLRIKNCYLIRCYLNCAKTACKRFLKGKAVRPLAYSFDIPTSKANKIEKRYEYFITADNITEDGYKEMIDLIAYAFESKKLHLQARSIILMAKMQNSLSFKLIQDYLIRVETFDSLRRNMICFLVEKGFEGKLDFIFGNVYQRIFVKQPDFSSFKERTFIEAYASCISRIAPLENDLSKIYNAVCEVIEIVVKNRIEDKFSDVYSLSAVFYELSNIKQIKRRREFLKFFDANSKKVIEYKSLINSYKNTQNIDILDEIAVSSDKNLKN